MKKIIALILALTMCLGMIVSVSAANPFTKKLALVKLIRAMFTKDENEYGIGELNDGVLTLYISPKGKSDADGTEKKPYASIDAAKMAIRGIDKSDLNGIDVVIGSGTYNITSTIEFTAEDSGTKNCPIRYIGEDGTLFSGGIAFDYTEFEKASGDMLLLFPEEVRDKLYMYDMSKLGYTPADIARMLTSQKYYNEIGVIAVDGKQMDLARYPNKEDGWIGISDGYHIDKDGNYVQGDWSNWGNKFATHTVIEYDEEHMDRILSWENTENLYVIGRYTFIWCPDDTGVTTFYSDRNEMLVPYSGAYFPREGGIFYVYNIPEELDVPGEYYVDENAILYYYPEENFETATFTYVTFAGNFITLNNAEFLTFENIVFDSARESGITGDANNITIENCIVRNVYRDGIHINGSNITVRGCEIAHVGKHALKVDGGDIATLTRSNNLFCNNYIHDWSTRGTMNWGIQTEGCGSTICHNDVGDSVDLGICACGPYHTVEYNYIYNTNQFFCDGGALNTHDRGFGTVLRYNVINGTGYASDFDVVGVAGIISDGTSGNEIYGNIVYNTTGASLLAAGADRDTVFHHNLCIKPGREALVMNCEYTQFCADRWNGEPAIVEDYLFSEIWVTAFPTLEGLHANWDPENPDDPTFFYAPVGNKAYNNYLVDDKAYETFPPLYDYKQNHVIDIEDHILTFSGENIETFSYALGNFEVYSSKRNKNPQTIGQALEKANAAVGVIMTPEQLEEVGRIGVDHGIGDMLIE
ncbi:MAG: right-handed parallel beta-helix repeat-containing protein [Clostridia bacterium]|nr:right-handed parallel beta-helix repeat-containing protein [Clostridia bacterium]